MGSPGKTLRFERSPVGQWDYSMNLTGARNGLAAKKRSHPNRLTPAVGYLSRMTIPRYSPRQDICGRILRLNQPVRRAMIYVTALGVYELRLNGRRVVTIFWPRNGRPTTSACQYRQAYDVTAECSARAPMRLPPRSATAGIAASGNTGLTRCGFMAMNRSENTMEIEFADGNRETIVSDGSWSGTIEGPIRFSGIYEGERYDARREMPGAGMRRDFTATNWSPVNIGTN